MYEEDNEYYNETDYHEECQAREEEYHRVDRLAVSHLRSVYGIRFDADGKRIPDDLEF